MPRNPLNNNKLKKKKTKWLFYMAGLTEVRQRFRSLLPKRAET